jgi:Beta-lactamase
MSSFPNVKMSVNTGEIAGFCDPRFEQVAGEFARNFQERGELDLDAPVTRYWPEFGQAGKEGMPVRMLLNHQAGLAALRQPLPPGAFWDWDLMVTILEKEEPWWTPGSMHGYHGLTFGWLVGEVVRRYLASHWEPSSAKKWQSRWASISGLVCRRSMKAA